MQSTKWVAIVTLLLLIVGTGCSRNLSRDVKDDVKRSLEQAGLNDVKVDQDRDTGVVTLSGQVKSDELRDKRLPTMKRNEAFGLQIPFQINFAGRILSRRPLSCY